MNYDSFGRTTKQKFGCRHRNISVFFHGLQQKMYQTNPVRITAISNNKMKTSDDTSGSFFQNITQNIICFFL